MPTFDRRFVFGSMTSALPIALLLCAYLSSPQGFVTAAWRVPWVKSALPEEKFREECIAQDFEAIRRRAAAHDGIIRELAAGRLTLPEAAARYREVDLRCPLFQAEVFRRKYPAASDEERYCLVVIQRVRYAEPLGAERIGELVARLEAELREQSARPRR
jgi:hypothetical protein